MQSAIRLLLLEAEERDAERMVRALCGAGYQVAADRIVGVDALARSSLELRDLIICPAYRIADVRLVDADIALIVIAKSEAGAAELIGAGADDVVTPADDVRLFAAVAHSLRAASVRRERRAMATALDDERRIADALSQVSRQCVAALGTATLLDRVCEVTAEVMGCDCSHTILWNPGADEFVMAAGYDAPEEWERVRLLSFPMAIVADRVARMRVERVRYEDAADLARDVAGRRLAAATNLSAILYTPLWRGSELIGVQIAGHRGPAAGFASWQREVMEGIGRLTSLALDNTQMLDRLTRADRIKSEFLATMSHELRTPLHHIIGFGDLLLDKPDELAPHAVEGLRTIGRSARDMLDLVNGVLDLQRLESAAPALQDAEIDVVELLRPLAANAAEMASANEVDVACELAPDLLPLRTDPLKLRVVLRQLVDNALKFTTEGIIRLTAVNRNGGVEFGVADTGVGIPAQELSIIFESFRQGAEPLAHQQRGVGLGLYVACRLVDLLGGRLTVDSEVGCGSTFRVWIPQRRPSSTTRTVTEPTATELYEKLLDTTSDLINTASPDGRLRYTNRAWCNSLGYAADEVVGRPIYDFIHVENRKLYEDARAQALRTGVPSPVTAKFVAKDGTTLMLDGSILVHFKDGAPAYTQGVFRNVTELEQTQRESENRRRFLESVLAALPVGVWVIDANGRIIHGNPAGHRLWGGARYVGIEQYGEYRGWSVATGELIAAEDWAAARAIRFGEAMIDQEAEIECFDGTRKIILITALPLRDAQQQVTGAIAVNYEITERRRAERILQTTLEALPAHVAVLDATGMIIAVNASWDRFAAANAEGPMLQHLGVGMNYLEVVSAAAREGVEGADAAREIICTALSGSAPDGPVEYPCDRDDIKRWFVLDARPLTTPHGGAVVVHFDITKQKHMETALRGSEQRYRDLISRIPEVAYTAAMDGTLVFISPVVEQVMGFTPEEMCGGGGKLWFDLVHPDDREAVQAAHAELIRSGEFRLEYRVRRKDGRYIRVNGRALAAADANGERHAHGLVSEVPEARTVGPALPEAEPAVPLHRVA